MSRTIFPIRKVNQLRKQADRACPVKSDGPEGWSKSNVDPMELLRVFTPLSIKQGYVLRAYQLRAGGNGNGIIWAMPKESPFSEPDECPKLERFLEPPKPPEALDEIMDTIEGDDSPWSYFCASLFSREAAEFGAMWHGCDWSTHKILGSPPRELRQREEVWNWLADVPDVWLPAYDEKDDERIISFHTYSGLGQEKFWRFTDRYTSSSLRFNSESEPIAEGPMGFMF